MSDMSGKRTCGSGASHEEDQGAKRRAKGQKPTPPVRQLQEKFDMRAADWIVNKMTLEDLPDTMLKPDSDYGKLHGMQDRGELLKILKDEVRAYAKSGGMVLYRYGQRWAELKAGRLYASTGLQRFPRAIRALLASKFYWDVDAKNAQPTLILAKAQEKGWAHAALEEYCSKVDEFRQRVMDHNGVDRDTAKADIIAIFYGCGAARVEHLPAFFTQRLLPELKAMRRLAYNDPEYAEIRKVVDAAKASGEVRDPESSLFAIVFQTEEVKVLDALADGACAHGRAVGSLVFDGGLVEQLDGEMEPPLDILPSLEAHILRETQYAMKLAVKPMECILQVPEDYVPQGLDDSEDDEIAYTATKAIFEAEYRLALIQRRET